MENRINSLKVPFPIVLLGTILLFFLTSLSAETRQWKNEDFIIDNASYLFQRVSPTNSDYKYNIIDVANGNIIIRNNSIYEGEQTVISNGDLIISNSTYSSRVNNNDGFILATDRMTEISKSGSLYVSNSTYNTYYTWIENGNVLIENSDFYSYFIEVGGESITIKNSNFTGSISYLNRATAKALTVNLLDRTILESNTLFTNGSLNLDSTSTLKTQLFLYKAKATISGGVFTARSASSRFNPPGQDPSASIVAVEITGSELIIKDGGTLIGTNKDAIVLANDELNQKSKLAITGKGSTLNYNKESLALGLKGEHSLTVENGGSIEASSILISAYTDRLYAGGSNTSSQGSYFPSKLILTLAGGEDGEGVIKTGEIASNSTRYFSSPAALAIIGDGGTLKATRNNTDFITVSNSSIDLHSGGLSFDTNSFDVGISKEITGIGAFKKQGQGTLTLKATNSYSGETRIEEGRLKLANTGSIANSSKIIVNGQFDVQEVTSFTIGWNQTLTGNGDVFGNVTVSGALEGTGAGEQLRFYGNLKLEGHTLLGIASEATLVAFGLNDTQETALADSIYVSGQLTLGGSLELNIQTSLANGFSGNLFYGWITENFQSVTLSGLYSVELINNNGLWSGDLNGQLFTLDLQSGLFSATAIPELSVYALFFALIGLITAIIRKKRTHENNV